MRRINREGSPVNWERSPVNRGRSPANLARSPAASRLATATTVAGAVSGAVGLLVGVLATRSVTAGAARFSDVGVFATIFASGGAFLGAVAAAIYPRRAPGTNDPNAPRAETPQPPALAQPPPSAAEVHEQALRTLREQAENEVPGQKLFTFAWTATRPDDNSPGPAIRAHFGYQPKSTADEIAAFLLSLPAPRLVVLGGPGAGKTVLARWLAPAVVARAGGSLAPRYASFGDWRPWRETFAEWMRGLTGNGRQGARPLLLLDDFDTLSYGRRRDVLGTLGNPACAAPFVLFSRAPEVTEIGGDVLPGSLAATLTLEQLSLPVIMSELQSVQSRQAGLERLQRAVSADPEGPVADALSVPAMLARARDSRLAGKRLDHITASSRRDEVEELLVADVVPERLFSGRWPKARLAGWLHKIALGNIADGEFRPNPLDQDALPGRLLAVFLVALAAAAAWLASSLVAGTVHVTRVQQVFLGVAFFVGMLGLGGMAGRHGYGARDRYRDPDENPRDEVRALVTDLAWRPERAGVIVGFELLGLLAAHNGAWAVAAPAALGAIAGLGAAQQATLRLAGLLGGALLGGIIGLAAHYAAQRPTVDVLLVCSGLIAAPLVVAIFAAAVAAVLAEGEPWYVLPAAVVASPLVAGLTGLMAGCTLVLGAHAGAAAHSPFSGLPSLLLYPGLWLAVVMLMSLAVLLGVERLGFVAQGVPVPLLAFLEDLAARGVLRRHGNYYEFKHPALRRVCLRWRHPSDWDAP